MHGRVLQILLPSPLLPLPHKALSPQSPLFPSPLPQRLPKRLLSPQLLLLLQPLPKKLLNPQLLLFPPPLLQKLKNLLIETLFPTPLGLLASWGKEIKGVARKAITTIPRANRPLTFIPARVMIVPEKICFIVVSFSLTVKERLRVDFTCRKNTQ